MQEVELGEYVADYAYHQRDLEGNYSLSPHVSRRYSRPGPPAMVDNGLSHGAEPGGRGRHKTEGEGGDSVKTTVTDATGGQVGLAAQNGGHLHGLDHSHGHELGSESVEMGEIMPGARGEGVGYGSGGEKFTTDRRG